MPRLITVPYLLGREGMGMGAGPFVLERAAAEVLGAGEVRRLALTEPFSNEVSACFDLNRQLAAAVAEAVEDGSVVVVLTGNCHSQQAVVAGLGTDGLGLVWFDCHADFHTPETTPTGFFDGCGLAMVVGDCWRALSGSVPGFRPLPEGRVALVGARAVDEAERERLEASRVAQVEVDDIDRLPDELARLPATERISLHVDLDVLDPAVGRANRWAVGPGLGTETLLAAVRAVLEARPVAALTLSAYDPAFDPDGRVRDVALDVLGLVARR